MSQQITVTKGHLDKNEVISCSYTEGHKSYDFECTESIHPDLREAFRNLDDHLAALCEQYENSGGWAQSVTCRGFSIKDDTGMVLSGVREVANSKSFAINTPFLHFEREGDYVDMANLRKDLETCCNEIVLYVTAGKRATDPQGNLFEPTADDEGKVYLFSTTESAANEMARLLGVEPGMTVLEPHAGRGVLIQAVEQTDPSIIFHFCEIDQTNREYVGNFKNVKFVGTDFLQFIPDTPYDRIIAAPPRTSAQDILHTRTIYDCLAPNGRAVVLISLASLTGKNKTSKEFVSWLKEIEAIQQPIENAAFDEEGSPIKTAILIIDKK